MLKKLKRAICKIIIKPIIKTKAFFSQKKYAESHNRPTKRPIKSRNISSLSIPIFVGSGRGFSDNIKYAYLLYVQQYGKTSASFLTNNKNTYLTLLTEGFQTILWGGIEDDDSIEALLASSIIITDVHIAPHGGYGAEFCAIADKKTCINLWHGIPIKDIGCFYRVPDKIIQTNILNDSYRPWHFLVPAPTVIPLFENYFPNASFYSARYPRNLVWNHPNLPGADINVDIATYEKIKKNHAHKITNIFFCPTFRDIQKDLASYLKIVELEPYLQKNNIHLYIKFHPYDLESALPLDCSLTHIHLIEKCSDIYPLLIYADILLTDISSILFDFALLEKPIFLIRSVDKTDAEAMRLRSDSYQHRLIDKFSTYPSLQEWLTRFLTNKEQMESNALTAVTELRDQLYDPPYQAPIDRVSSWIHSHHKNTMRTFFIDKHKTQRLKWCTLTHH